MRPEGYELLPVAQYLDTARCTFNCSLAWFTAGSTVQEQRTVTIRTTTRWTRSENAVCNALDFAGNR
jgi:hypothetical protein